MSASFNPRKPRAWYDDEWTPSPGTIGSHHAISAEGPERDPVAELHEVVEEVTRKPVMRHKSKIGFY